MSNSSFSPTLHSYNHNFTEEDLNDILGVSLMEDPRTITTEETPGSSNSAQEDEDDLDGISADAKAQARSERKRSREKQRRSDVNKQFADLTQLLRRIESEEEGRTLVPIPSAAATNRVDLIARTITIMERTHELSKKRKAENANLQKQLDDALKMAEDTAARLKEATLYQQPGPQKQVMMMVPMMVNPDAMGGVQPGATATAYPHAMMPQIMSHPYMVPQMTSHQPSAASAHHMMMPQMMYIPQQQSQAPPHFTSTVLPGPQQQHHGQHQQIQQQQVQQQQSDEQPKPGQQQNEQGGNLAHCA